MSIRIDRRKRKPIGIGGSLLQYVDSATFRKKYELKFKYIDARKPIIIELGGDDEYYWMDINELENILNEIEIQKAKIGDINPIDYKWLKDTFDEEKNANIQRTALG